MKVEAESAAIATDVVFEIEAYFKERGFGFGKRVDASGIRTNLFFHVSSIISGDPIIGAKMQCDIVQGKKGPVATNIRIFPVEVL
jgi:cold shock CspA family protein